MQVMVDGTDFEVRPFGADPISIVDLKATVRIRTAPSRSQRPVTCTLSSDRGLAMFPLSLLPVGCPLSRPPLVYERAGKFKRHAPASGKDLDDCSRVGRPRDRGLSDVDAAQRDVDADGGAE